MKVTVEDKNTVKKIVHVEMPETQVTKELNKEFNKLKKNAKIKGFRPGKAPKSLLERMYGKSVRADLTLRLVNDTYQDAIKQSALAIIGSPELDPSELKEGEPFCYDIKVEIQPQIGHIDFKGLTLEKTVRQASDEEVDLQIKMLQSRMAETEAVEEERAVVEQDLILIDYEGFRNGKPIPELEKTQNMLFKVGVGAITKEFDEQVIGMRKEDSKDITVTFPKDYQNTALADTTVRFHVVLNEIRKEILPEINDEWASKAGPFKTLAQLKENIRTNIDKGYAQHTERELYEMIYTQLLERTSFDVPDAYVRFQLDAYIEEFKASLTQNNKTMESEGLTQEILEQKYSDMARNETRRYLLMNQIIQQEKLELSDEDLEKELDEISGDSEEAREQIKKFYDENPERLDVFKQTVIQKQAIQLIQDSNSVTVVPSDLTDTESAAAAPAQS
ncbi:trigger factor [Desulfococcaceae bacterium HSG7]|nr:trigger factor [Desulfococcaceae bacterium HSG7]